MAASETLGEGLTPPKVVMGLSRSMNVAEGLSVPARIRCGRLLSAPGATLVRGAAQPHIVLCAAIGAG